MANSEHLLHLKRGVAHWNEWRRQHLEIRVDLMRADLSGLNLKWIDLRDTDLIGANLQQSNLAGADLRWANLSTVDLQQADLRGADLSFANLTQANVAGTNFTATDLREAILTEVNIDQAIWTRATLSYPGSGNGGVPPLPELETPSLLSDAAEPDLPPGHADPIASPDSDATVTLPAAPDLSAEEDLAAVATSDAEFGTLEDWIREGFG